MSVTEALERARAAGVDVSAILAALPRERRPATRRPRQGPPGAGRGHKGHPITFVVSVLDDRKRSVEAARVVKKGWRTPPMTPDDHERQLRLAEDEALALGHLAAHQYGRAWVRSARVDGHGHRDSGYGWDVWADGRVRSVQDHRWEGKRKGR